MALRWDRTFGTPSMCIQWGPASGGNVPAQVCCSLRGFKVIWVGLMLGLGPGECRPGRDALCLGGCEACAWCARPAPSSSMGEFKERAMGQRADHVHRGCFVPASQCGLGVPVAPPPPHPPHLNVPPRDGPELFRSWAKGARARVTHVPWAELRPLQPTVTAMRVFTVERPLWMWVM